MNDKRLVAIIAVTALAIGGLATGVASHHSSSQSGTAGSMSSDSSMYSYYQSVMSRYGTSSMMSGSPGQSDVTSYQSMMGGTRAPGWMDGGALPGSMMETDDDPGQAMGELFAGAPGARISSAKASRLGDEDPLGATVDTSDRRITFSGSTAKLVAIANPAGGTDETFRISSLVDPTIRVKKGTQVTIEVINADPDAAHGLVVTRSGSASSWMPMVTSRPAFSGAALWFLGDPTSSGMHVGRIRFIADRVGTYQYLCAVPGHAQKGMVGTFLVVS